MPGPKELLTTMQERITQTYYAGVLLAVNAVHGVYTLVDGPNCAYKKGEYIDKNHDLFSDLFSVPGAHRIAHTDVSTSSIMQDRMERVEKLLRTLSEHPRAQAVMLCSLPAASLTGIHYDQIVRAVSRTSKIPIIEVPAKNLRADWLEGYGDVMRGIAEVLPLKKVPKKKKSVAIIGYLMDRTEGDHRGNCLELKRILKTLGLDLISTWFSGQDFNELRTVERAEHLIVFPYGAHAAKIIAKKTGAHIIPTGMPFGLQPTKDWLLTIGKATKAEKKALVCIEKGLHEVMPVLEWVVPHFIAEKKFSIAADPVMADAFTAALTELGGEVTSLVHIGRSLKTEQQIPATVLVDPTATMVMGSAFGGADIFIGNSQLQRFSKGPYVQFGFPSPAYHCFSMAPFLGFKGFVNFANRIVNAVNSYVPTSKAT